MIPQFSSRGRIQRTWSSTNHLAAGVGRSSKRNCNRVALGGSWAGDVNYAENGGNNLVVMDISPLILDHAELDFG